MALLLLTAQFIKMNSEYTKSEGHSILQFEDSLCQR